MGRTLAVKDLLGFLESPCKEVEEEALSLLSQQLCEVKDVWLMSGLLQYFFASNSSHVLEVILNAPEHHDKHFLSLVGEGLRQPHLRFQYTCMLFYGVRRNPPPCWIRRLTKHTAMRELLTGLDGNAEPTHLVAGLMVVIVVVTTVPHDVAKNCLTPVLDMFWRMAHWTPRRKEDISMQDYLRVTLYSLFSRLYSLFPCNVVNYLRYHTVGMYNKPFFLSTLQPMFMSVRLHPMLLVSSKESELDKTYSNRDCSQALVECSRFSLDSVESSCEEPPLIHDPEVCSFNFVQSGKCWIHSSIDNFWSPSIVLSPLPSRSEEPTTASIIATPVHTTPLSTPIYTRTPIRINVAMPIPESPPEAAVEATPETTPFTLDANRQILAQSMHASCFPGAQLGESARLVDKAKKQSTMMSKLNAVRKDRELSASKSVILACSSGVDGAASNIPDAPFDTKKTDGVILRSSRKVAVTPSLSKFSSSVPHISKDLSSPISSILYGGVAEAPHSSAHVDSLSTIIDEPTMSASEHCITDGVPVQSMVCESPAVTVLPKSSGTSLISGVSEVAQVSNILGCSGTADSCAGFQSRAIGASDSSVLPGSGLESSTYSEFNVTSVASTAPETSPSLRSDRKVLRVRKKSVYDQSGVDMLQFTSKDVSASDVHSPSTDKNRKFELPTEPEKKHSEEKESDSDECRKFSSETSSSANEAGEGVEAAGVVGHLQELQGLGPPATLCMTSLVKSAKTNRLRFLSQCGPPLNVAQIDSISQKENKPTEEEKNVPSRQRSKSCSAVDPVEITNLASPVRKESFITSPINAVCKFEVGTQTQEMSVVDPYEKLIETFLTTVKVPSTHKDDVGNEGGEFISPYFLLNNYIHRKIIDCAEPLHKFDLSKVKNADDRLRNQIYAMYSLLLLERHKREIHANRNRILLAKSKKIHILLQEQIGTTMKLDAYLEETRNLKSSNRYMASCYQKMKDARDKDATEKEAVLKEYGEGKEVHLCGSVVTSLTRSVKTSKGEEHKEKVIVILHRPVQYDEDKIKDNLFKHVNALEKNLTYVDEENINLHVKVCELEQQQTRFVTDQRNIEVLQEEKEIMRQHMAIMKVQLTIKDELNLEAVEQLYAVEAVAYDMKSKHKQESAAWLAERRDLVEDQQLMQGLTGAATLRLAQLEGLFKERQTAQHEQVGKLADAAKLQQNKVKILEQRLEYVLTQNRDMEMRLKQVTGEREMLDVELRRLASRSGYNRGIYSETTATAIDTSITVATSTATTVPPASLSRSLGGAPLNGGVQSSMVGHSGTTAPFFTASLNTQMTPLGPPLVQKNKK